MAGQRLKWWTLIAACFALFMAILDNLVVNIALPTISRDLNATTTQLQWIVSAYTLIFASLQITAGGLGDRLGRKRWFLFGLGLFTTASLFGALSQNITMLIAARAVQGLGAAFIMPLSLSLISVAFPPEERGKALGIWSAISVSGLALGPIVGGVLVEYANWHWVFIINIPIGIIAFFVASTVVQESRDTSGTVALDIPGTALITGAIASLTWGLIEAGERGWGDTLILAAFAAAAVLTAAFIAVEARTEKPMVPLRFFRSPTFSGANMDAFAVSFLIAGVAFYMTLYQQNIHGFSPVRAGLAMLPMVITMMVCSPISGLLIGRIGSRTLITLGMSVAGVGTLLFLRSGVNAPYMAIVPAFVVMGFGMSMIFAPMTTAVLNSVESEKSGVASAINGAIREIGTAFGIALLGTIMNRVYQTQYNGTESIAQARSNSAFGPVRPLIDLIGSGAGLAGRVIEDAHRFPGLPADLVAQLRDASGRAFVTGMDRAIVISSGVIIVCSVVSYFLIKDPVAASVSESAFIDDEERVPELVGVD
jgi:EmrB/QacA subfamily drug resistance transporter